MCLGIPALIVERTGHPHLVRAEVFGADRQINIGLMEEEELGPGDWVLIHVGFAIARLDPSEVEAAQASLRMMGPEADGSGLGDFGNDAVSEWESAAPAAGDDSEEEVRQWAS